MIESIPFNEKMEIIVVDNASKEDETSVIANRYPQVKTIRSDRNLGFAGGNNLGIVENGRHCTLDERSIAYIENPNARNDYSFRGENYKEAIDAIRDFDVNNPEASVDRLNNVIKSNNANNGENTPLFDSKNDLDVGKIKNMQDSYIKFQNSSKDFCNKYGVDSTYGLAGEERSFGFSARAVTSNNPDGINRPTLDNPDDIIGIYDLQGKELPKVQKGINIIRYKNGSIKKQIY